MKNLVNYAVKYAEKGLSVLPMINKKPLIKFADLPPLTVEEVKKVWQEFPYAQIGVRTTNFFVIDIDTKSAHGKDGYKSIEEFKDKYDLLPETLAQQTSSGGMQLFYLKRSDIPITQRIGWLPGVDVKAHDNNYVLIAPSEHNGLPYKWLNKNPIVTPSEKLIQLINKRPDSEYSGTANYQIPVEKTTTSELFEKIVNGLGETGGRNNALASFIGGLLFRNVDVDCVYQLAQQANDNTPKPLSPKEFDTTFDSMVKKEIRRRETIDGISRKVKGNAATE